MLKRGHYATWSSQLKGHGQSSKQNHLEQHGTRKKTTEKKGKGKAPLERVESDFRYQGALMLAVTWE